MSDFDWSCAPAERPQWGEPAAVIVPKLQCQERIGATIKPGSAIVAYRLLSDLSLVQTYYEGNMLGASNLNSFEERALTAYGRMSHSYPTRASMQLSKDDFEVVGEITPEGMDIDRSHPALQAWMQRDPSLEGLLRERFVRRRP